MRCKHCGKQVVPVREDSADIYEPSDWIHLTGLYHCNLKEISHGLLATPRTFSDYFNAIPLPCDTKST